MDPDLYDEFGNYVGPYLESEDDSEEEQRKEGDVGGQQEIEQDKDGGWWSLGHHYIHQRQAGGGLEMGGRGSYKGDSRVDVVIGERMLVNLRNH